MSELTNILRDLKPIRTTRQETMRAHPTVNGSCSTHDCCASTQHGSVGACSIVTVATATTALFGDYDAEDLCLSLCESPSLWQSVRCQEASSSLASRPADLPPHGTLVQDSVLRAALIAGPAGVDRSAASASTRQTSQCGVCTRQASQCGAASQSRAPVSDWTDSYLDVAIDHAFVDIASPSPAVPATACAAGAGQRAGLGMGAGAGCGGGRRVASTGLFHDPQLNQQQPAQPLSHQQPQQPHPHHHHHHHPMQLPALYGLCPQPSLHRHAYLHTCHPAPATTSSAVAATASFSTAQRPGHSRTASSSTPIPVPSPQPGPATRPRPSAVPFIDRAEDDEVVLRQRQAQQQEQAEQLRQRLLIEEEADLMLLELQQQEREEQQKARERQLGQQGPQRRRQQQQQQQAAAKGRGAPRDWRENKMLLAVMGYYNAHRHERAKRESLSGRPAEPQRVVMGFAL
ncbi:hypothetical protein HYH02_002063 [Chlamydomonas schloesseri]|uniref:Uncharacterized protein n=1 Tax=Chlamydomonas schloesseri TaxID=2026947 RepID=A0A835WWC8_9CHLO|nr:hypothetical protein HYH02_002063 [Chlamydomonas schloesseri]|eukprot:KAG2453856.1 hypothetical protein HYH02_002063 [Chlamydomonas schloesseri]